jgi:Putative porin
MFKRFIYLMAAASFVLGGVAARAQDAGALLDLLVRKKLITDQEAEEVRSELTKQFTETPAGKWKMSTPITELELYGDARLRYEYRGGRTADDVSQPNDWLERDRWRYRLRIGLRGTLADDWFFGIRLETSQNNRSTNVTFGDDTSTTNSDGTKTINGPFAKNSDGINVGQAYLGYKGFPDITLTGGKMPNPLVTTLMVWDADINPEGAAEQWKHTFTFSFGQSGLAKEEQSYSKDNKALAISKPASEPWKLKIDVFANFAQFIYDDTNPENPVGQVKSTDGRRNPTIDAWMMAWQVGARFNFPKNYYFQIAPVLYNYAGNGDTFNSHFVGGDPSLSNSASLATNQSGINSLLVLEIPSEFGFKIGELPVRIFGDFAVNFEAGDRARAAGFPDKGDQRYAYMIGAGIGQLKAKHDWQIQAWYQHTDQYAVDPNLVDSDIWDSRVNMQGVAVQGGYALSDAVIFNITYGYAWRADKGLGTGGTGDIGINPLDKYQILQADLNVKF